MNRSCGAGWLCNGQSTPATRLSRLLGSQFHAYERMTMRIRPRHIAMLVAATLLLVAVPLLLVRSVRAYRHYKYPYGWSHCCDKAVG